MKEKTLVQQLTQLENVWESEDSLSFEDWWNDQENGCPTLVLDNDEQFARAVWDAAIKSTKNNATRNIQPIRR
jgi:hypothetical protein